MLTKNQITDELIFPALDELALSQDIKRTGNHSEQTALFGKDATLDSLGLVTLLSLIEGMAQEKFGLGITLASESAFSRSKSPFRTVASLAEYIEELAKEPSA